MTATFVWATQNKLPFIRLGRLYKEMVVLEDLHGGEVNNSSVLDIKLKMPNGHTKM